MQIKDILLNTKFEKAPKGFLPYIEIGDIDINNKTYILKDKGAVAGAVKVPKNVILVSTVRPNRGAITIVKDENVSVSNAFAVLEIDESVCLKEYLFFLLNSSAFLGYLGKNATGATYPTCSKEDIYSYNINVPSIIEQERIMKELSKITEILRINKDKLEYYDELVKARFVELFGTPLLNEKGWRVKSTGDVCSVTDGSHFSPAGKEEGYPMLSVRNMRNDGFHYDDCKLVSQEDYDVLVKQGCKPLKNDVLIAKDGSYFYYGFVVKEEIEQAVLSSIAILRPNLEQINPEYLCRYMLSSEIVDLVGKNYVTGAAIKRVILKGIKKIPVMLPPIELQNQFAAFVEQTDKSKLAVQKSLDKLEVLKKALMQKYFN